MPPALTKQLAALIQERPVSESDLRSTALFTLDAVANIIGGSRSKQVRPALDWARSEPLNVGRTAVVYGACATVLEMDAMHRESAVHAGTVVVPAVLALAQAGDWRGRELLIAILKGSEAAFRIGRAAGPGHYKTYQNTATCGPYGSAMAAALLLRLQPDQTVHALGNAGTQAGGLWEFRHTGAMTKQLHAGRAAEAGIVAAQLAARGMTGPLQILEGTKGFFQAACPDADTDAVLRGPEDPWGLLGCSIKPWPSSRHTHPAIDAALGIDLKPVASQVASIEVETYQVAVDLCGNGSPKSPHQGKSSIQYCVAAALAEGRVDFGSFEPDAFARHQALLRCVNLKAGDRFTEAYPRSWGAQVVVRLVNGDRLSSARSAAKGDPESPLSEEELKDKARGLLSLGGVREVEEAIETLLDTVNDKPLPKLAIETGGLVPDWR